MMKLSAPGRRLLGVLAIGWLFSCNSDTEPGDQSSASLSSIRDIGRATSSADFTKPVNLDARGPFFRWLPKDTLFVAHIPNIDRAKTALGSTDLAQALQQLDLGNLGAEITKSMSEGLDLLKEELGEDFDLATLVNCFGGNTVLAVTEINPMVAMMGQGFPASVVLYTELDGGATLVKKLVRHLAEEAGGAHQFDSTDGDQEKILFETEFFTTEVLINESMLAVGLSAPNALKGLDDWMNLQISESFVNTELANGLPATADESFLEVLVNLEPVWQLVSGFAGPEAQSVVQALGVEHIKGLGAVGQVRDGNIHESMFLYSPGQRDFLSKMFSAAEVDEEFIRWIPAEVSDGGIVAFSLAGAFDAVRDALPPEARSQMDFGMSQIQMGANIDIRSDILENFGPNFAFGMKGSPMLAAQGHYFEFVMAIEVQDKKKTDKLINMLLETTGMIHARRSQTGAGKEFFTFDLPAGGMGVPVNLEPSYAVQDGALVIGSSSAALRNALLASQMQGKSAPKELQVAAENLPDGTISLQFSDVQAQLETVRLLVDTNLMQAAEMANQPAMEFPSTSTLSAVTKDLQDTVVITRVDPRGMYMDSVSSVGLTLGGAALGWNGGGGRHRDPQSHECSSQCQ